MRQIVALDEDGNVVTKREAKRMGLPFCYGWSYWEVRVGPLVLSRHKTYGQAEKVLRDFPFFGGPR